MGKHKITEDRARADDQNQPETFQNRKENQWKTIGNHKITEDRARADDYNQPET